VDRLAEAAPRRGMTDATGGRGNVRVRAFTGENLNIRVFSSSPRANEFVTVRCIILDFCTSDTAARGQKAKYSPRAHVVRSCPNN
jgi:hypothetical protein